MQHTVGVRAPGAFLKDGIIQCRSAVREQHQTDIEAAFRRNEIHGAGMRSTGAGMRPRRFM
ncbi:MAG: hypothetical protein CW338_09330 [Clostridiales bacterium]|nr:hypothetical protein [Clostridiales bacterium]